MSLLARLALLFILVPLAELVLLIEIGRAVGLWPTVGLVVLTGVAGAALARREGLRTIVAFQGALQEGRLPRTELMDGVAVLVGGALLLTPGLITDVLGFVLLLPPSRRWVRQAARRSLERRIREGTLQVVVFPFPGAGSGAGTAEAGREGGPSRAGEIEVPPPNEGER